TQVRWCDTATIRERNGRFHVQVRMTGHPTRTASFRTERQAERWATTIEAAMIEGRHFLTAEALRHTFADAIDRYIERELPKKRSDGAMHRAALAWWRAELGHLKLGKVTTAGIVDALERLKATPFRRARPD